MNLINCMNIQILVVNIIIIRNNYDVVGGLVMGLSEKSGWGLKFSTLEPPGTEFNFSNQKICFDTCNLVTLCSIPFKLGTLFLLPIHFI